jgi:hypothetical protein
MQIIQNIIAEYFAKTITPFNLVYYPEIIRGNVQWGYDIFNDLTLGQLISMEFYHGYLVLSPKVTVKELSQVGIKKSFAVCFIDTGGAIPPCKYTVRFEFFSTPFINGERCTELRALCLRTQVLLNQIKLDDSYDPSYLSCDTYALFSFGDTLYGFPTTKLVGNTFEFNMDSISSENVFTCDESLKKKHIFEDLSHEGFLPSFATVLREGIRRAVRRDSFMTNFNKIIIDYRKKHKND